ncbi:hypothetical protein ABR737_00845 [Streptomyces sp. Edi2]|uniref:hypothetical protein n=1 Tax=Streptomyces sp. Edi2 TaxID=3162528 RepID=UPI003305662A
MDRDHVNIGCLNAERNFGGDAAKRKKWHKKIREEYGIHLLFRQENWDILNNNQTIRAESEEHLPGMRGWVGEKAWNAVYADPSMFRWLGQWPNPHPIMTGPPCAVTLQMRDAGPESTPIIAMAGHLTYCSPTLRKIESEITTVFNDKWITLESGESRHAVMIGGLDTNAYANGPKLPLLHDIEDRPHRAHRSHQLPDGTRAMDQYPHDVFATAGLVDVAAMKAASGQTSADAPSVAASPTHGPDARVDVIVASRHIATDDLWESVEVIATDDDSDHDMIYARIHRSRLAEKLRDLRITAA